MPVRCSLLAGLLSVALGAIGVAGCIRPASSAAEPWVLGPSESEATSLPGSPWTATPFMPSGPTSVQVLQTPTPNPPSELPPIRTDTDLYTVQFGDTLMKIAQLYGITVEQIIAVNELPNPDYLEVGQVLVIPAPEPLATGPGLKLIPDSELVYSPSTIGFDVGGFVADAGGFLASYTEEVDEKQMSGAAIVARVARENSVNPRLLLAVLEHQSGWVSRKNPAEKTYPIGLLDANRKDLFRQLSWAADTLNRGYYLWRAGGLSAFGLTDGSLVPVEPTLNAGTVGIQYFFAQLYGLAGWQRAVGEEGLMATYAEFFGYPFQYTFEPLVPQDLQQPPMQLPFQPDVPWYFTGGPHGGWADGSGWAALDFAPPGEALGCVSSDSWVVAVADGLIVRTGSGQVILDLDGDGHEQTGWTILYMHIETRDRVAEGSQVEAGDRIGHPSCEGGYSTGTHLHIARRYNGEWIPADQETLPFVMDGWISSGSGYAYDGWLVKGNRTVVAENGRFDENEIIR